MEKSRKEKELIGLERRGDEMERTGAEKELRRRVPTRAETEMNRLDGMRNGTAMR